MTNNKTIPARSEADKAQQWHVEDIFPSKVDWEAARVQIDGMLTQLTAYKGKLSEPSELLACFTLSDNIDILLDKIYCYASLQHDADTTNPEFQAMLSTGLSLLNKASAAGAFIQPELIALPAEELSALPDALPGLNKYRILIDDLLRRKQHILSAPEEQLLSSTLELRMSARNTYSTLTNTDMKFPDTLGEDGSLTALSTPRYTLFMRSANRAVRQDAFTKLMSTYLDYRNTLASLYSSSLKATQFIATTRKYSSMLEMKLTGTNNIPTSVYDATVETVNKYLPLLHRYIKLKKRLLGLDELHMYDLYVPMVEKPELSFSYADARKILKEALAPLGEQYVHDLFAGLDGGWVDYCENKGKRSGAYSNSVYAAHPYVLMTYNNDYDSVSTLAHEMGHSMHSFYSNANQPYVNSCYTIFCAEVASTTNENLLLNYMLKSQDKKVVIYFLNQFLEQVRTTIFRQTMFAEFEKLTHEALEAGQAITADYLEGIYLELNKRYYGDDMIVDDLIKAEWSRIPHFYSDFYVYQYSTGLAAAITLSEQILAEGEPARQRYLDYLKSGASADSITLLKRAGADMTTSQPFDITFKRFEECLDKLEALC